MYRKVNHTAVPNNSHKWLLFMTFSLYAQMDTDL